MTNGIKITRVGPDPYREDIKHPSKPIVSVKGTDRKDAFLIEIHHPNKSWFFPEVKEILQKHGVWNSENRKKIVRSQSIQEIDGIPSKIKRKYNLPEKFLKESYSHDILYSKIHRFKGFSCQMEAYSMALSKGNEILESKFKSLETEYEDIKYIPHYKKESNVREKNYFLLYPENFSEDCLFFTETINIFYFCCYWPIGFYFRCQTL